MADEGRSGSLGRAWLSQDIQFKGGKALRMKGLHQGDASGGHCQDVDIARRVDPTTRIAPVQGTAKVLGVPIFTARYRVPPWASK